jgi:hypothetical protein
MPINPDRPISRRAALAGLAAAPLVLAGHAKAEVPEVFGALIPRILELIGRRDYLNDQLNVVWFYVLLLYREDRREEADMSRQTYERFRQDFRSEDTFQPVTTDQARNFVGPVRGLLDDFFGEFREVLAKGGIEANSSAETILLEAILAILLYADATNDGKAVEAGFCIFPFCRH